MGAWQSDENGSYQRRLCSKQVSDQPAFKIEGLSMRKLCDKRREWRRRGGFEGDRGCRDNLSLEGVADRGQTGSASGEIAPDSRGKKIARGDSSPEGGCQNGDSLRYGLCVRRQALSPSCGFGDNWGRWMVKM